MAGVNGDLEEPCFVGVLKCVYIIPIFVVALPSGSGQIRVNSSWTSEMHADLKSNDSVFDNCVRVCVRVSNDLTVEVWIA